MMLILHIWLQTVFILAPKLVDIQCHNHARTIA